MGGGPHDEASPVDRLVASSQSQPRRLDFAQREYKEPDKPGKDPASKAV